MGAIARKPSIHDLCPRCHQRCQAAASQGQPEQGYSFLHDKGLLLHVLVVTLKSSVLGIEQGAGAEPHDKGKDQSCGRSQPIDGQTLDMITVVIEPFWTEQSTRNIAVDSVEHSHRHCASPWSTEESKGPLMTAHVSAATLALQHCECKASSSQHAACAWQRMAPDNCGILGAVSSLLDSHTDGEGQKGKPLAKASPFYKGTKLSLYSASQPPRIGDHLTYVLIRGLQSQLRHVANHSVGSKESLLRQAPFQ